jgi:hypothetical protein
MRTLAQKYGIHLEKNNGSIAEKELRLTLVLRAEGVSESEKMLAQQYGFPEIGGKFNNKGFMYEVVGWNFRSTARPVICAQIGTDKKFLFPASVKAAISRYNETIKK